MLHVLVRRVAAALILGAALPAAARPPVYGWVEYVDLRLRGEVIHVKAKLDSGAKSASLHAVNVQALRRGNQRYVRFQVPLAEGGNSVALELPVVRYVRIKNHEGPPDRRPVVRLPVCLGERWREIPVNLVDRGSFLYPVLLGRTALSGAALIDPGRTFQHDPSCPKPAAEH